MALIKQINGCITSKEPYNIKGRDGEVYKGFIVEGIDQKNKSFSFGSREGKYTALDLGEYEAEKSISLKLFGRRTPDGKIKWSDYEKERKSLDKDFSEEQDQKDSLAGF
jgi:hypothetical protein